MAITATFTADFTKWNAALRDAQQSLRPLEVSAKGAQSQLQKMATSLSGVNIKKQADLAVEGVKAIGGASKLTESEQRKLNATLTEAIAKYRVLGQEAPREMLELAEATRQVDKPTQSAAASAKQMFGAYVAGLVTVQSVQAAFMGIVRFLGDSIQSYAEAERATVKLTTALRNQGRASDETIDGLEALAAQYQRTTRFSDDLITETQALFVQIGDVAPEQMDKALGAATDLAEGLGIDLEQAAMALSKALQGNETALKKMAPSLSEAALKGGDLAEIAVEINKQFGGQAAAALDTYSGRVQQLANDWDNVKEAIGKAIVTDGILRAAMRTTATVTQEAGKAQTNLTASQIAARAAWATNYHFISTTITALDVYAGHLNRVADLHELVGRTAKAAGLLIDAMAPKALPDIGSAGMAEWDRQNEAIDAAKKAAEAAEKAYQDWAKSVTGLGRAMAAAQLEQRLSRLTREGRLNQDAIRAILTEYEGMRQALHVLSPSLERFRTENQETLKPLESLSRHLAVLSTRTMPDTVRMIERGKNALAGFNKDGTLTHRAVVDLGTAMQSVPFNVFNRSLAQSAEIVETLGDSLRDNLIDSLRDIPDIIVQGILEGASAEKIAIAVGSDLGAAIGGSLGKSLGKTIGGSIAPILGEALGEALGSLIGPLIDAIVKTRAEKTVERVAYEFGVGISEELAQGIEDESKRQFGGNRQASKIFHLEEIISEAGGLDFGNFQQLFSRFRDVFVMLETGAFDAGQAVQVLDENFRTFADFVTEGGSLASAELLEIIHLAEEAGLKSAEVIRFTTEQSQKAVSGIGEFINTRGAIVGELAEAKAKLDQLRKDSADDSKDIDPKEIQKATEEVARLQAQLAALPLTAGGASAVGASLFAIFEQLTRNGEPALEVLRQLDPLIESLDQQLRESGLSGGEAFESLKGLADFATDEKFAPALKAISGLNSAFEGLHNSGLLNQETFEGLAEQVGATYEAMIAQGADGEKALALIQPTLQTIWELQKDFGYEVDETTQKMLDEAEAQGKVGDKHRTVQEQMLLLQERMTLALEGIATLFGVTLPGEVGKFDKALGELPKDITIDGTVDWDVSNPPVMTPEEWADRGTGGRDSYDGSYQRGEGYRTGTPGLGFVNFGSGRGVTLHGQEAVVPYERRGDAAAAWGGGNTSVVVVVLPHGSTAADLMRALPKEAKRNENQFGARLAAELAKFGVR